ncbi:MAG: gamma-glutamyltranspeptidase [Actinomycetia bacterium]|nr:gamma-glutamyltranspeptidase [Actinomycetes bacterium]
MASPVEVPSVTVHSRRGMVSSVDHLASNAGVAMLRAGGSAADAAVATSAMLAVTTQHMCGMGGDLWALIHHDGGAAQPDTLNASGWAGSGADPDAARAEGLSEIPLYGDIRASPVPGCVDGWMTLHGRHGRLSMAQVLAPAIDAAAGGFPASPHTVASIPHVARHPWATDYTAGGAPRIGSIIKRPGVARTLEAIADDGRDAFYLGEFGDGLLEMGRGEYTRSDLEHKHADWVDPVAVEAFGHTLWTTPPNSQGYLSLASAWIADGLDLPTDPDDPMWAHLLIESSRQAGYDRPDVLHQDADGQALVSPHHLTPRRDAISEGRAGDLRVPGAAGDTIYLCAVDENRMGVSLIQSNAGGWGSGLAEPSTRIFLHNRGLGFNLIPGHGAEYRSRRRPPHTLSPALVTNPDGSLRTVLGTMGGDSQPQVVLQMLARLLHCGQSPSRTVASGRWRLYGDTPTGFHTWADPSRLVVQIEGHAPAWASDLENKGHRTVTLERHDTAFGHAHLIDVRGDVLAGCADPRAMTGAAQGL